MSDHSQGPGWWFASDGKWYPPWTPPAPPAKYMPLPPEKQSRTPDVKPRPTAPTSPVFREQTQKSFSAPVGRPMHSQPPPQPPKTPLTGVSRTTSLWTQVFFWVAAGSLAISTWIVLSELINFNTYWNTPFGSDQDLERLVKWIESIDTTAQWHNLNVIINLAALVMFVIFLYKSHNATQTLQPTNRTWSSGWVIGGWFIPVANLVIPKLVQNEIERIATSKRHNGVVTNTWRNASLSGLGWYWWLTLTSGLVISRVSIAQLNSLDFGDGFTSGTYRSLLLTQLASYVLMGSAYLIGTLWIRNISDDLDSNVLT